MKPKTLFSPLDKRRGVDLPELAELTGWKITTLREYANRGEIHGAMRGGKGRRWWFEREGVEKWWASLRQTEPVA
jgi:hypothetical protein